MLSGKLGDKKKAVKFNNTLRFKFIQFEIKLQNPQSINMILRNKTKSKQFRPSTGKLEMNLSKRMRTMKIIQKTDNSPLRPSSQDYHTSLNHKLLQKNCMIIRRHNESSEKKNQKRKRSQKVRSNQFFLHNLSVQEQNQLKQKKNDLNLRTRKQKIDLKNNHNQKQDKQLNPNKILNKQIEKSAKKKDKNIQQQRETKQLKNKLPSFKTFIGSKLRKKLQSYLLFVNLINYSIKIKFKTPEIRKYTVYVGKGNNSKLIKKFFRNRFWWNIVNKNDPNKKINLVWSQWSKPKVFNSIPKANTIESIRKSDEQQKNGQKDKQLPVINQRSLKLKQNFQKKLSSQNLGQIQHIFDLFSNKEKQLFVKKILKKELKFQNIKQLMGKQSFKEFPRMNVQLTHNHIENHQQFTNKKNLFRNLKSTYPNEIFDIVPLTYHVTNLQDSKKQSSLSHVMNSIQELIDRKDEKKEKAMLWIVKPGENSNRGCGIQVFKKLQHIKCHIEKQKQKHSQRTFIVQKYLNPFLYHRRKFDIRCYLLVTASPSIKAYYYPVGYIRTSSYEFSAKNYSNKFIHLTNDAIQKKQQQYGKYQKGNKVTYEQFQNYLDMFQAKKQLNFFTQILPKMQSIMLKTVHAMVNADKQHKLNPNNRQYSFQLYGYDFMIDQNFLPWLIQINTNPCLETGCEILQSIIPPMIENIVKICVDTVFPPPKLQDWPLNELLTCSENIFQPNLFKLIYDQQDKITK